MAQPVLQVITASTRPGRVGTAVAGWFTPRAEAHGHFAIESVDLAELGLPMMDEPNHPRLRAYTKAHTKQWSESVDRADAFVFVMPEYNHAFTAPLKNALDYLHTEWQHKPVGFVSYGGVAGGTRAVQLLKPVVDALKLVPLFEGVIIPFVGAQVDDGVFAATDIQETSAIAMLDELARVGAALRTLRACGVNS